MTCDAESPVRTTARKGVRNSYVCGADGARLKRVEGGSTTLTSGPIEVRDDMAANEAPITDPHPSFRRENGERAYLHRDHLGSIGLVTDELGAEEAGSDISGR